MNTKPECPKILDSHRSSVSLTLRQLVSLVDPGRSTDALPTESVELFVYHTDGANDAVDRIGGLSADDEIEFEWREMGRSSARASRNHILFP